MKPTLLLGCGLPAVGKTTIMRSLQRSTPGSLYLDKDTINIALLSEGSHAYFSDYYNRHVRNQTYAVMFHIAKDNLAGGCPLVIMDGQFGDKFTTSLVQQPLQDLCNAVDCQVRVVYCHCSKETQLARMRSRGEPRDDDKYAVLEGLRAGWLDAHHRELAHVDHLRLDTDAWDVQKCVAAIQEYVNS